MLSSLKAMVSGQLDAIDGTAKLSDRLNISTESILGLRHAADLSGVSFEQFDGLLEKMVKTLGNAAQDEFSQTSVLLQAIGLNAQELSAMGPDKAFLAIADGIKGIVNPADRAMVATELFGRAGQKLLNTLTMGSEGILEQAGEVEKLGASFSRVDAAKVEAANDALTRVGRIFEGIAAQLAINLGPFIEAIANRLIQMGSFGRGAGLAIVAGFEGVAKSIAFVADIVDTLFLAFDAVRVGWTFIIGKLVEGLNWLVKAIQKAAASIGIDLGQGGSDFLEVFADETIKKAEELNEKFDQKLVDKSLGERVMQTFNSIKEGANAAAQAVATTQANMGKLGTTTSDTFKNVKEESERLKKLDSDAKALREKGQTPLDQFRIEADKLSEMFGRGLIDKDQFALGLQEQKNKLAQGLGFGNKVEFAGAATRGSTEAISAVNRFRAGSPEKPLVELVKLGSEQNQILREIASKTATEFLEVATF